MAARANSQYKNLGVFCYSKYMSTTSYKKLHHVYYTIAWSVLSNGERRWYLRPSTSKTPEEAFKETRECILHSKREDFEMKLAGFRFE